MKFYLTEVIALIVLFSFTPVQSQDTIVIGFGGYESVETSSSDPNSNPQVTLDQSGFLPNDNAASRFLAQATLGYDLGDIDEVKSSGIEDWIANQMSMPMPYQLKDKVEDYYEYVESQLGTRDGAAGYLFWEYAWWNYHMSSNDLLRQRVALALSEILVISEKSQFGDNPHAMADYYDILLRNAFGNYRTILQEVTYHASMGVYLTFLNNPKTDITQNRYPDENYAREIMQLFTIGLFELNNDGTRKLDGNNEFIPTYDNLDIIEYSKVFTGLTWGDGTYFFNGRRDDTSYAIDMVMFNDFHEPGIKNLLRGEVIDDGGTVNGDSDISLALDNLFNHPNVGPFISKLLIQRLVTSNPPNDYVSRVATIFNNNGSGVRGDIAAVVKAILLDPYANSCQSGNEATFGMLREPFIRYLQVNKAFEVYTVSGNYRNVMYDIEKSVGQKPLGSPSVFNFFQPDYQPLGPVQSADLVAPEFQITDSQTITGWLNSIKEWIFDENLTDEWNLYTGEPSGTYDDERSLIDFSEEVVYSDDENLHILLDKLNLLLAHGRLTQPTLDTIKNTVIQFDNEDAEDKEIRAKLTIYMVLSSPEYLINR